MRTMLAVKYLIYVSCYYFPRRHQGCLAASRKQGAGPLQARAHVLLMSITPGTRLLPKKHLLSL